jgi:hypothetical protein
MEPHLSVLEHCVGPRDATVLVARCSLAGTGGRHMMMLTRRRLVVTTRSRLTRRLRLYLNLELRHLCDVNWTPERRPRGVRLAVTAIDGVREHFLINTADAAGVDQLLSNVFQPHDRHPGDRHGHDRHGHDRRLDRHNFREVVVSAGV